jgi:hypothetical protein
MIIPFGVMAEFLAQLLKIKKGGDNQIGYRLPGWGVAG